MVQETNNPEPRHGEKGSVMLVALFVMVILSMLGAVFLNLSNTESFVAYNALWSEGAFYAAEAGVQAGIDQLSPNMTTATAAIATTALGDSYNYRSGRRTDAAAQPLQFIRSTTASGYSVEAGTGYNPSGYSFYVYQINVTGTGPRNAVREVEVQAEFGPVAQ
jgi:Tfp pilus assembly protein PilX